MTGPTRDDPGGTGIAVGDVLAGKYRVEKVLGMGGMGVVLAARHVALDERVALKLLRRDTQLNAEATGRFLREARAAAKIRSEHVARVRDVAALDDGTPYMVLEYLEGRDLAAMLEHLGPFAIEQACDYVIQACEAVAEAHALGIIHRDLKPANLFCVQDPDGRKNIKVLDFGVSKFTQADVGAAAMTKTSQAMGSPYYMSPEQMKDAKSVDARTDVWALGIILYELMTGRRAFDADTVMELAIKVATESPNPMRTVRPDVPVLLDAVVLKCLEKDRRHRYDDVVSLVLALRPFASFAAQPIVDRIAAMRRAEPVALVDDPSARSWGPEAFGATVAGQTAPDSATSTRLGPWTAVALGAVLASGAGLWLRRSTAAAEDSSWSPSSTAPRPAETPAQAPLSGDPSPVVAEFDGGQRASTTSSSATHAPSRPAAPPVRRSYAPGATDDCDPPYTLDDQGRKHFKHGCFGKP